MNTMFPEKEIWEFIHMRNGIRLLEICNKLWVVILRLLLILKCHDNLQLNLPLTNASSVGVEGGKRTLRFLRLYPCIRNWKSSSAFCMVSFKSVHMSFFLQFYAVILLFSLCSIDSIWYKCWKCIYLFLFKKKKKKVVVRHFH